MKKRILDPAPLLLTADIEGSRMSRGLKELREDLRQAGRRIHDKSRIKRKGASA